MAPYEGCARNPGCNKRRKSSLNGPKNKVAVSTWDAEHIVSSIDQGGGKWRVGGMAG